MSSTTLSALKGATGPAGATGARGATGATGPRGPSDVFEAVQSNSFVAGTAGTTLKLELTGLPAGSYAISEQRADRLSRYFSSRDSRRSLSTRPAVWSCGQ
jgi:hypothetical protein